MGKDKIFILKDRGVLYISGDDAKDFLQNIITNDINKVSNNTSCFASLLTPQGKYLFDFIIAKHKKGYFIDCEKNQIKELFNRLGLYKLRSKTEILDLSNEFTVAVISKEKFLSFKDAKDVEGNTINYKEDPVFLDPRDKRLGARLLINLEKLNISLEKLNLKSVDPNEYYALSHKLGIPQVNTNKLQNKIFALECNFEELNAIDHKKGCYVGQENTARMKLRNKIRKRIFPIISDKQIFPGKEILFEGKTVGTVLISEPFSFGLIKLFDPSLTDFQNKNLKCEENDLKIVNAIKFK